MRNQTRITICTIVRNRAYLLPHVYETLLAQTRFHFEWLIMDQERQGQLRMLTSGWRGRTEPFVIRVAECQENGRMQAVQMALDVARGEYFCLLEAEEFLEPEAMACILDWLAQIQGNELLIGVSGAKCYLDGRPLYKKEPRIGIRGYVDATCLERQKYGLETERFDVVRTDILRKYPLLSCSGEIETPLQLTLDALAMQGYRMRWYAQAVCRGEYLCGSKTLYERRQERRNPMSYAMLYNHRLGCREQSFGQRFDAACRHVALSLCAHHPEYIFKSRDKKMSVLALLPGIFLAIGQQYPFT